jgi:peptide/nickel transport system substrate-binding protein
MVEMHTVDTGGTVWTLQLRGGLRFHNGAPVLARDVAASIRRFSARDGLAGSLMNVTTELSAPDDRTVRFRLSKPFPHLPEALGGAGGYPAIMPERLASNDPFRPLTEMVGSGPFRFVAEEFNVGQPLLSVRLRRLAPTRQATPLRHPAKVPAGPRGDLLAFITDAFSLRHADAFLLRR